MQRLSVVQGPRHGDGDDECQYQGRDKRKVFQMKRVHALKARLSSICRASSAEYKPIGMLTNPKLINLSTMFEASETSIIARFVFNVAVSHFGSP
jgi:hypothetical protein